MSKRIEWIDMAKVLTMFLVIFDHLGLRDNSVHLWVWSYHLPAFFLLSGIFYKPLPLKEQVKKDIYRLLLPVVLWYAIGLVSWQAFSTWYFHKDTFASEYLSTLISFINGTSMGFGWFMVCLFWIRIELNILCRTILCIRLCVALVVMPLMAWSITMYGNISLPYYIVNSLMAFPFFYIGYALSDQIKSLNVSKLVSSLLFCIFLALSVFANHVVGKVSLNAFEYGNSTLALYVAGLIGSAMIIFLSQTLQNISNNQLISALGGGTMVLLLFQPPFLMLFKIAYKKLFHVQIHGAYFDTVSAAITSIIIMLLMYPCIKFINKRIPMLNGMKKNCNE